MKSKSVLFFLLFLTEVLSVKAQSLEWAKGIGGINSEQGRSIKADAFGNTYFTGYYENSVDFDPGPGVCNMTSNGYTDIFISKLDAKGKFVWAKSIGGIYSENSFSIDVDASGYIYITGYYGQTVDFDPGPGIYNLTFSGWYDTFVLKMDTAGNFVWAKKLGGVSEDIGMSITTDDWGNVYTTGWFQDTSDFDPGPDTFNLAATGRDFFISKLDSNGNFLWAKSIGGKHQAQELSYSITTDMPGNVYITGNFIDTVDFDPGSNIFYLYPAGGCVDAFVLKLTQTGNFVWAKSFRSPENSEGISITTSSTGDVYSTGIYSGIVDFDPGPGVYNLNSTGGVDVYISKLDSAGNFLWAKSTEDTGSVYSYSLSADVSDNVYITGCFTNTVDFDPGPGIFSISASGLEDAFVLKLDSAGSFIWAVNFGGNNEAKGFSVTTDSFENVFTTGWYKGNIDFNPGSGVFSSNSSGEDDIFVCKFRQHGVTGNVFNDLNQNCVWEQSENGLPNHSVTIVPGNISVQTNDAGIWAMDTLPPGVYNAIIDTSGNWLPTCPVTQVFTITNSDDLIVVPDFGLVDDLSSIDLLNKENCADILLFPNPASTYLFIEVLHSFESGYSFELADALGRLVLSRELLTEKDVLSVEKLQAGIYTFIFRNNSKIISRGKINIIK